MIIMIIDKMSVPVKNIITGGNASVCLFTILTQIWKSAPGICGASFPFPLPTRSIIVTSTFSDYEWLNF